MAAENNKNPDSVDANPEQVAKVGDGGNSSGASLPLFLKHPSKRLFVGAGVLVVLIVIVVVLLITGVVHNGNKVYAEVDGHKIYKSDLMTLQSKSDISDKIAATMLADKYLYQAMAKQHHLSVSKTDITAAGCPNQQSNPYGYQNCVNQLYIAKLNNNNAGLYKGELLVANFSKNLPYQSPLLPEQKKLNPNIGNSAIIAADKSYALNFITDLYNKIQAHKITFDQAIQIEHKDPKEGIAAYPTQNHSGPFDDRLSQINLLAPGTIRKKIESIKPGTITKPFPVPVSASINNDSTQESYYLVVKMDKVSGGGTDMTFQQALAKAKKQLGYKVNV